MADAFGTPTTDDPIARVNALRQAALAPPPPQTWQQQLGQVLPSLALGYARMIQTPRVQGWGHAIGSGLEGGVESWEYLQQQAERNRLAAQHQRLMESEYAMQDPAYQQAIKRRQQQEQAQSILDSIPNLPKEYQEPMRVVATMAGAGVSGSPLSMPLKNLGTTPLEQAQINELNARADWARRRPTGHEPTPGERATDQQRMYRGISTVYSQFNPENKGLLTPSLPEQVAYITAHPEAQQAYYAMTGHPWQDMLQRMQLPPAALKDKGKPSASPSNDVSVSELDEATQQLLGTQSSTPVAAPTMTPVPTSVPIPGPLSALPSTSPPQDSTNMLEDLYNQVLSWAGWPNLSQGLAALPSGYPRPLM